MSLAPALNSESAVARGWLRWLVPVGVALAILAATSWPKPPSMPHNSDKLVHLVSYAALGASVAWAAQLKVVSRWLMWCLVLSMLGAADEWHQQWIPSRRADVRDWAADTVGAVLGLSLVSVLSRRREFVA
jgi:VanZ family protein